MKFIISFCLLFLQTTAFTQSREDSISLVTATGTLKGSLFVPGEWLVENRCGQQRSDLRCPERPLA